MSSFQMRAPSWRQFKRACKHVTMPLNRYCYAYELLNGICSTDHAGGACHGCVQKSEMLGEGQGSACHFGTGLAGLSYFLGFFACSFVGGRLLPLGIGTLLLALTQRPNGIDFCLRHTPTLRTTMCTTSLIPTCQSTDADFV